MVDIHCHILPEIDDGSRSWEMTAEMCRLAVQDGVEHIVATPHANEKYPFNPQDLLPALEQLRQIGGDTLTFSLGCEFFFDFDNLTDALARPEHYALAGTPYLLMEFSPFGVPPSAAHGLGQLLRVGLRPIIAHPERNPMLARNPEKLLEWVEKGCILQVTAGSLTGFWGDKPRKAAQWLLKRDAVHVLASDAHDEKRRTPVLAAGADAAAELCGDDIAHALVEDNPRAIVAGHALPFFPRPLVKS